MPALVMMVVGLPLSLVAVECSPNLWVCIIGVFVSTGIGAAVAAHVAPEHF
jgi:hypothetical protein